jgi:hypothetical protein
MQKSYECEIATHIGPESCGAVRKSSVEALTAVLTISRKEHSEKMPGELSFEMEPESKTLPPPIEITETQPVRKREEN